MDLSNSMISMMILPIEVKLYQDKEDDRNYGWIRFVIIGRGMRVHASICSLGKDTKSFMGSKISMLLSIYSSLYFVLCGSGNENGISTINDKILINSV
jgi:hypothetical protein